MLIPIGTDIKHSRHPMVTYLLIGLNLLLFAVQWSIDRSGGIQSSNELISQTAIGIENAILSKTHFHLYSLFTYQFLHGSWLHIIGNMIFLLPFGKAVEDRMGHLGFAAFYLGCGAFGGWLHTVFPCRSAIQWLRLAQLLERVVQYVL